MFSRLTVAAVLAVICLGAYAEQKPPRDPSRGELLYTTNCIACHTSQVHWRDKKMVNDWTSLELEIRRWQGNAGLAWSKADVTEVARYLNLEFYHFPGPG